MDSTSEPSAGRTSHPKTATIPEVASSQLKDAIALECEALLRTLQLWAYYSGLANNRSEAQAVAEELLSDTTLEVLEHVDKFDTGRLAKPWILSFARIAVRRMRARKHKTISRETSFEYYANIGDELNTSVSDEWKDRIIFDCLMMGAVEAQEGPEDFLLRVEENADIARRLAAINQLKLTLSDEDQEIIDEVQRNLFDFPLTARELGIAPAAARARFRRAAQRLKEAYFRQHPAG